MGSQLSIDHRLATYGTLAPGRPNHHHLADLPGDWRPGTVRGSRVAKGWGAALGYPAIVLEAEGQEVDVHVFESAELPNHWQRLDAFEGSEYRRVPVTVATAEGSLEAWIYISADPAG